MNTITRLFASTSILFCVSVFAGSENDFIQFASQGNLAQLRTLDYKNFDDVTFRNALLSSTKEGRQRTTTFLLSQHEYSSDDIGHALKTAILSNQESTLAWILFHESARINNFVEGYTPLMWAAQKGSSSMVKNLLLYGARTDLRSASGETAYDIAKTGNNREVAEMIEGSTSPMGLSWMGYIIWHIQSWSIKTIVTLGIPVAMVLAKGVSNLLSQRVPVGPQNPPIIRVNREHEILHQFHFAMLTSLLIELPQQLRPFFEQGFRSALVQPPHLRFGSIERLFSFGMMILREIRAAQALETIQRGFDGILLANMQRQINRIRTGEAAPAA